VLAAKAEQLRMPKNRTEAEQQIEVGRHALADRGLDDSALVDAKRRLLRTRIAYAKALMPARLYATAIALMTLLAASWTSASDSCTISYRVDASFQVTDTYLGKGDSIAKGIEGSMVIEFPQSSLSRSAPELRRTPYLSTFSDLRQGV
jgi:hypothetical protein